MGYEYRMSIIRPPVKRRPGRMIVGLLAVTTAGAAFLPAVPSAQAKARHHLVFKVAGKGRQDVIGTEGIVITARCPTEACIVVASARSRRPALRTGRVRARVAAGGSERIVLPLTAREDAKLRAAVEAGKSPSLTVRATAKDGFGSEVPLKLTIHPVKP